MRITLKRRIDGWFDYRKENPAALLETRVPPIFEKIEAQLQANQVPQSVRERIIDDLNRCGMADVSVPELRSSFFCLG
jgi:hypothetical protein